MEGCGSLSPYLIVWPNVRPRNEPDCVAYIKQANVCSSKRRTGRGARVATHSVWPGPVFRTEPGFDG